MSGPLRPGVPLALLGGLWLAATAGPAAGQQRAQQPAGIRFESDLPRTLVFIAEQGEGQVATRDFVRFLREAGFPLIDPALAQTGAQRDLVQKALQGDEGAATNLGRDFGAQVLVIGRADWGARPDPVDRSAMTATSEVEVRALRLDAGKVIATARANSRKLEATEQAARTAAIREATAEILSRTSFIGQVMNNWESEPWQEALYWKPDPGSVPAQVEKAASASDRPGLAILSADVAPASGGGTRGLGVVKRGDRSAALFNPVRLEGVVVGPAVEVKVEGKAARLEPLPVELKKRLGIEGDAQRFVAETTLPLSKDTVKVVAVGPSGATTEAVAAPRIDQRWAVVIGIGQYQSPEIPDLQYAGEDARAVHEFLTSATAGPFEKDHILFLQDERATAAAMREALFVFLQKADWDDLVVIYFAGHGAPDPNRPDNLYLLPYDTDLKAMAATAFPMWDVKTALRRQIAAERVVVIADACHSAGTQKEVTEGAELGRSNPIASGFAELFAPSRRLSITAADVNEFSLEDARWGGHGVFTYFLLEALKGAGDGNSDGIITFTEAYDYLTSKVPDATNGRQNPQRAGFGDVPLAVVESKSGQ
ncbi:MAG: caspase family protein [Gemmatimonadetes bacterium]|nr:caspase family protein [Gemmatimonadota bacterium]